MIPMIPHFRPNVIHYAGKTKPWKDKMKFFPEDLRAEMTFLEDVPVWEGTFVADEVIRRRRLQRLVAVTSGAAQSLERDFDEFMDFLFNTEFADTQLDR